MDKGTVTIDFNSAPPPVGFFASFLAETRKEGPRQGTKSRPAPHVPLKPLSLLIWFTKPHQSTIRLPDGNALLFHKSANLIRPRYARPPSPEGKAFEVWRSAKQQFITQETIPGTVHVCRSPDKWCEIDSGGTPQTAICRAVQRWDISYLPFSCRWNVKNHQKIKAIFDHIDTGKIKGKCWTFR